METCIFIPDSGDVKFIDLILDGKKHWETRKCTVHLPIYKWIGIARNKMVVGEVILGRPLYVDRDTAKYYNLYQEAYISGTPYDMGRHDVKLFYPILKARDMRDNPKPVLRNSPMYGKY